MGEETKFNKIYDNLFRCMYNLKPTFPSTQDGDSSMKESLNLLTAASYAKAYPAVRLVIENHLLQFNQLLWFQVERRPETWASTACKLHSAAIFREAMIHLAGRYHLKTPESINKKDLECVEWGKDIFELAAQKGRELKDYKLQVERRLLEFVPPRMLHPPVQHPNGIVTAGRQIYAGEIYWWMCLHLVSTSHLPLLLWTNIPSRFANTSPSRFFKIDIIEPKMVVLHFIAHLLHHTHTS